MALAEPRVEVIEGQKTLVAERRPPLQQKLDGLLAAMPHPTYRDDIHPMGMAKSCDRRDHRFRRFREGRHVGLDGVVRDLTLAMCQDCGACIVRDVSFDRVPGLPIGRGGPRRKDDILGWYSGARRNRREYQ